MTTIKKLAKTVSDNSVTFSFHDAGAFTVDIADIPEATIRQLALHGISQKVGDACSGEPDPALARGLCEAVAENLRKGVWATRASGGGKLAQALSRVSGRDLAECVTVLQGLDEKQKRALRKDASIAKALLEIERERLDGTKPAIDVGALFGSEA